MGLEVVAGTVLDGRYVLKEPLGRGGMGTVWRAEHVTLGTGVAVKLMDPGLASSDEGQARFRREARLAASLHSPNIIRILDFGLDKGTPYIAMELLEGETLGSRLARTRTLPPEDVVRITSQIARGIACAHAGQAVHRDLKPENVLLARIDGEEIVKVLDFGRGGAVLGTSPYMSPEQLEGRDDLDLRSDLWSLAVIVFECVCGSPAFGGDELAALVQAICFAPMPVPSHVAKAPPAFDAWFARAASRDSAARFESARVMAEALSAALGLEPTEIPSFRVRTRRGGSELAGFELFADVSARMLHMKLWGLWGPDEAMSFRKEALGACDELAGAPWVSLSESSRHPPQKHGVQAVHRETMSFASHCGMTRAAIVVETALGLMQVRRLTEETGLPNVQFFQDEASARAWLAAPAISTAPTELAAPVAAVSVSTSTGGADKARDPK